MTWEAWFTVAVISVCFWLLASSRAAADIILLAGLTLLLLTGVLSPQQALAGLSNEGMATVGILFVVVTGLKETGAISYIVQFLLGQPKTIADAQRRIIVPCAIMSAFINNIPIVSVMIPAVYDWVKRNEISVSKIMLPLSYATIAGGTCTLIGTSTNLVVNGLLIAETGRQSLGIFEISWVGLPCAVLTIIYIQIASPWLLKERRSVLNHFENAREYTVEMLVDTGSPVAGKTVGDAGLRQLPGLFLIEIDRNGHVIPAVSSHEKLYPNDRLIFTGIIESIVDLQKIPGITPATKQIFKLNTPRENRIFIEAVVSNSCPLVGKSIREGRFRTIYNAAIIAVARNGERINLKLGDIILTPGDTLLLEASPSFVEQQRNSRDFYLVSSLGETRPLRQNKMVTAVVIVALMVAIVASGWLSMLQASMLAAGVMLLTRCTSGPIARRAVDWQVLIVIAASIGIGNALQITGAAETIAHRSGHGA